MFNTINLPVKFVRAAAIDAAYQYETARQLVERATRKTGLNSRQTVTAHRIAADAAELARRLSRKVS